jgi:hypothetical protein
MKGVLKWLATKLSRHSTVIDANDPQSPGLVQSHEPGKDILMPDIHGFDGTITQRLLRILDDSSPDDSESAGSDESTGGDPYSTS